MDFFITWFKPNMEIGYKEIHSLDDLMEACIISWSSFEQILKLNEGNLDHMYKYADKFVQNFKEFEDAVENGIIKL